MVESSEEIELVFLPTERIKRGVEEAGVEEEVQKFVTKLADVIKWFQNYKIDSIELSIAGEVR